MLQFYFYILFIICLEANRNSSSTDSYINVETQRSTIIDGLEENVVSIKSCFNRFCASPTKLDMLFGVIMIFCMFFLMLKYYISFYYTNKTEDDNDATDDQVSFNK
ncbi:hypothetical protein AAJ76_9000012643 [Vairimorpha ceranae]|uniref:Uncharacterized protein n=1 Tax=Vairimorpha ceranae TaxID=40302 RepID=A0A0F9W9C3_9MICR|nr:hypothetical protein AAJ76_9000012643 [Vairimorpha ceranae]KAF5139670.1 hypothetical protein G9O61_00g021650 [Vairimorpha ceranae]KAF5139804.1 hypothetical protein G9O61_00g019740 [Vairimorpha ceranae]KKO74281.1 hypothetical protein AAJ76_9000012643 [Vairimorpha ceranae]